MAHNITPVPENAFETPVRVPDGTDSPSAPGRAADVEAIAQALLNRAENLRQKSGMLGEQRVWTATQTMNVASPAQATRAITVTPASTTYAQNAYRLIDVFETSDNGKKVRVYCGTSTGGASSFVITTNAWWNTSSAQNWNKDVASRESSMLAFRDGEVRWTGKEANAAPWTTWSTGRGHFYVGDTLFADTVQAETGDIETLNCETGEITSVVSDSATSKQFYTSGNYRLSPARRMWIDIPLSSNGTAAFKSFKSSLSMSSSDNVTFPLPRLPVGSLVHSIEVLVNKSNDDQFRGIGVRRHGAVWNGNSSTLPTNSDIVTATVSGTGRRVLKLDFGATEIKDGESYEIVLSYAATVHLIRMDCQVGALL